MKPIYKYFKTEKCLITHKVGSEWYKIENCNEPLDLLNEEDFISLVAVQINKQEFARLMNIHFKNVTHHWKFDYTEYKKLPNFEIGDKIFNEMPRHEISKYCDAILVYHWGRVYYFILSGNYFPQGQLCNPFTKKTTGRWANIKNLAPIYNIGEKKIV